MELSVMIIFLILATFTFRGLTLLELIWAKMDQDPGVALQNQITETVKCLSVESTDSLPLRRLRELQERLKGSHE